MLMKNKITEVNSLVGMHASPATTVSIAANHDGTPLQATLALHAAPLGILETTCDEFCSPEEINRLKNLTFPKRRASYLLGRYAAKAALWAQQTTISGGITSAPTEVIITTGVLGQPVLDNVPGLGVTITHTDGTAAAAIFPLGIPLGIDLEIVSENNREALKDLNTSRETAMTRNALNESTSARVDTTTTHTLLWSIKEALSKTLGCGLTASTQLFEIKGILQHNLGFIAKFRSEERRVGKECYD